jgi:molybdopterin converting factor small subunit
MNQVKVWIPPALREFVDGSVQVDVVACNVTAALAAVGERYPGFLSRVLTPDGQLRPRVNVFVGEDNIRTRQGLATGLIEGDIVAVIPAVAGG